MGYILTSAKIGFGGNSFTSRGKIPETSLKHCWRTHSWSKVANLPTSHERGSLRSVEKSDTLGSFGHPENKEMEDGW